MTQYKDKEVLVTGGSGFIGSHLVRALVRAGAKVTVLDTEECKEKEGVRKLRGDIRNETMIRRGVLGKSYIFHMAANASIQYSINNPQETNEINLAATVDLAHVASQSKTLEGFVFSSSCAVYGNTDYHHVPEAKPCDPQSPYAMQKACGEGYLKLFNKLYSLPAVSLRYFNVYGPGQKAESSYSGVIAQFCRAAREGVRPIIYGDGKQTRDFVYVDDVVEANLKAALHHEAIGQVFNIGTGKATSINDLWKMVCLAHGVDIEPHYFEARPGEVRFSGADNKRAWAHFDFRATTNLRDGLRKTLDQHR